MCIPENITFSDAPILMKDLCVFSSALFYIAFVCNIVNYSHSICQRKALGYIFFKKKTSIPNLIWDVATTGIKNESSIIIDLNNPEQEFRSASLAAK